MTQKSDLPFGSEFSPSQVDLPTLLDLASVHEGNVEALQSAIQVRFFSAHGGGNEKNRKTLAMNCRLGMKAYGLIDQDAKLTQVTKTTAGRGAKPFLVAPTSKLVDDVVTPLLGQLQDQVDQKLLDLLRKPFSTILEELNSEERYIRGLALEALAFKLMRLLDMGYVATRLRAQATGGAEVDLVFESARLVFSRWQVQCKNTQRVSLEDVAKEVGLKHLLKSNVIVIVSTGDIGPEARRYANKVMADSNLCIVMIDHADLAKIKENPVSIVDAFNREAHHAMTLKKLEL